MMITSIIESFALLVNPGMRGVSVARKGRLWYTVPEFNPEDR